MLLPELFRRNPPGLGLPEVEIGQRPGRTDGVDPDAVAATGRGQAPGETEDPLFGRIVEGRVGPSLSAPSSS